MTDREKLIELLCAAEDRYMEETSEWSYEQREENYKDGEGYGFYADHLIADGVTVQQWIPATELPDVGVKVLTLDKWGHVRDRELYQFSDGLKLFRPDGMLPGKDITHWRPMLQGPEEN